MISALYRGEVIHRRLRPKQHSLRYRIFSLYLDLDELELLAGRLRLFSRNRFAPLAFHDRDHLDGSREPLRAQIERKLAAAGIEGGGPIRVLTMPRLFGFVFNPLSVWFCHARDGALEGIVWEVNNTFGERHCYVLPAGGAGRIEQSAVKAFHVSPFLPMGLAYDFRIEQPRDRLGYAITASDGGGMVLSTVHTGLRRPFSDRELALAILSYPLMTLKVVAGILWEASRLWFKRVPVFRHPARVAAAALEPAE